MKEVRGNAVSSTELLLLRNLDNYRASSARSFQDEETDLPGIGCDRAETDGACQTVHPA